MNEQLKHSIIKILNKIEKGIFEQEDIKLLLIDIRDFIKNPVSIIRELGDFIAHPNSREKGITFDEFKRTYSNILNKFDFSNLEKNTFSSKSIFRSENVIEELCSIISELEFIDKNYNEIFRRKANDINLCIAGIINGSKIQTPQGIADISLGLREGNKLTLWGNVKCEKDGKSISYSWPIFRTNIIILDRSLYEIYPWGGVKHFVAGRDTNGKLCLKKLDTDLKTLGCNKS